MSDAYELYRDPAPVARYISLLNRQPPLVPLHRPSQEIRDFLRTVEDKPSFHKAVMRRLISNFRRTDRITAEVAALYEEDFKRIAAEMASNPPDYYELPKDPFVKDLSICCGRTFPAGAQIVETMSGVGRSVLFGGGLKQLPAVAAFFTRAGGFTPWYQIHTHSNTLAHFNEDGWSRCYLRIAGMLRLNPKIKGMFGISWFYDPALEEISPRLNYLRHVPLSGGARLFRVGGDPPGGALAKSETRRKLYEQGKYKPTAYLLIWRRDDLIRWAAGR